MCCWGPEGCQWGAFGFNALSYSFKHRFPRKQNDCVQTLVVFPNSTGTPESHLVASYTLCELKNPLRPKRAALPTPPVNQRQPAGTEYRPPLGSEKLTEIEAVCSLYQNLTYSPPPFGQVLPSTAAPCKSCLIGFGASVLADQCLIHTASPPACRQGSAPRSRCDTVTLHFQPQRSKAIVAFLSPTFHLGDGGKKYRSAQPGLERSTQAAVRNLLLRLLFLLLHQPRGQKESVK